MFHLSRLCKTALILALASSVVFAQDEKTDNSKQQRYWYKIEALVFMHLLPVKTSKELLTKPESLDYPEQWRWVTTREEQEAFMASLDVSKELQDIPTRAEMAVIEANFPEDPILIGTVPEDFTRPDIGSNNETIAPLFEEASNLESALLSLQEEAEKISEEPPAFVPPKAFFHIEDKEQDLAKIWQQLRWSRGFRPLWYRSWHQKILPERPDLETSILVEGPVNERGDKLIQGSLSFWQESYLHTRVDLWMFDFIANVGQPEPEPGAPELRQPYKPAEPEPERELLFTMVDDAIEHTFMPLNEEDQAYTAWRFSSQVLAGQVPEDELAAPGLFTRQTLMLSEPELKLDAEDLQTDEILLKTQPVYQTSQAAEELLQETQLDQVDIATTLNETADEAASGENLASSEDFEQAQMLALTAPLIESYKKADFFKLLETPRVQHQVWALQEKRRIKKSELHYFDHPYFGLIIKITPYEPPEPEALESDLEDES